MHPGPISGLDAQGKTSMIGIIRQQAIVRPTLGFC
ncbi:pilus assembly protein, partial [Pseudomonas syringae pv. actinidiae]|nr:pilus assembly protein [Pseudomonas syringae pv. actinidiae]